ncbi:MAG TPA: ATP-dependent helicase HrpB [Steroidobacteraceae bacterium]
MNAFALPDLPILEALPALKDALDTHCNVILHAPPGAGKSTVVPLALLEAAWLSGKILMLEPRRLAARAVATRMASMLGEPVGKRVGFRTRLETRVSASTRLEVVTEGILTRMLQSDASLQGIGCVIFDEFHERSLNADLGLALTLECQQGLREDLRILVMSATLDAKAIGKVLTDAPLVSAAGKSFKVHTHHLAKRPALSDELHMANVVRMALKNHGGDILCFLPGAAEIRRVQRALESGGLEGARVLPLYGELDPAAQDAALNPLRGGQRKVVLATSIAETSLTIEGIRVVVDSGLRRYSEFDPTTGMSRLVTGKVSQAAADQRRGRAGRLSEGDCYRLWSEGTQATLEAHSPPEILHADLSPLALELACWGSEAKNLAWIDPPPPAPLAQATDLLKGLGAIDAVGRISEHGKKLAPLGMHPRLSHMLLAARALSAERLACDLAAVLSERDVLRAAPGARDADVRLRAAVMRGDKRDLHPGLSVDERALSRAKRTAQLWQRDFVHASRDAADPDKAAGILLALAYPDRIGRSRGRDGRYLLANGRGAHFAEPQALAKSEFIIAAELDGTEREARIFLAAPIGLEDLERHFAPLIVEHAEIRWDEREGAIRARRERRLGAVVLASGELAAPDPDAMLREALSGLRSAGIAALPWTRDLRQWQARVELLRRLEVPSPAPWPDLSDAGLLARLEEWAAAWMEGIRRRDHFAKFNLAEALKAQLNHAQSVILRDEAPTHFVVPSGSSIAIDYLDENPSVSVRLQELFGLKTTPAVAKGRMSLLLKMLSPAGRPVQITRDLVSFWDRGYHEVKKDLKGRYPKHYWPDDPHTAQPTRRARPR